MSDVLGWMKCFQRVVERGSFSAVAKEWGVGQPAISKQIASLERYLGATLLLRSTHDLSLTDAGQTYYQHCVNVLSQVSEAEAAVREDLAGLSGTFRLTCSVAFGRYLLLPRLPAFFDRHPRLRLQLLMNDARVDLVREGVDMAVRFGRLEDSEWISHPLGESRRGLYASASYLARRGAPATPAALEDHDCLLFSTVNPRARWVLQGPTGPHTVSITGRLLLDSAIGIRGAVLAGLGIGLCPEWLLRREIATGEVQAVLPDYQPTPIGVSALYPRSAHASARRRSILELLHQAVADVHAP